MKRAGWLWTLIKVVAGALLAVGMALVFALSSRGGEVPASVAIASPTVLSPSPTANPDSQTIISVATMMAHQCTAQPDAPWCQVETPAPTPPRPAYCVPLPQLYPLRQLPLTPTPDLAHPLATGRVTAVPIATVTPLPITHSYDLDPDASDKWIMIIFRCNGEWDEYWLVADDTYRTRMSMQPGDVLLYSSPPAAMMGQVPPTVTMGPTYTPRPTALPVPTATPYPPGWPPTPYPTVPLGTAYPAGQLSGPGTTPGTPYPAP